MTRIHRTAIVDPAAELADGVEIGPYCIVEADVRIGAGTVLRPYASIRRYTTLGEGNYVDFHCVLGGEPQDLKFTPDTVSHLRIGDGNVFREGVTISRGTGQNSETRVGSRTYWMANSHAGHNAVVEDEVILVNGALLAGHTAVGRRSILSGNAVVHQFSWIGELVMVQGMAGVGRHVPPFTLVSNTNDVVGLNAVGLRRAEYIDNRDRLEIKELFHEVYRSGLTPAQALEEMDRRDDLGAPASRFREFVRRALWAEKPYDRGLCQPRTRRQARQPALAGAL